MTRWLSAAALIVIGSLQMLGDVLGLSGMKALGAALHASPAPKVFTAQNGYETFASRFFIDWTDAGGQRHALEVTPRIYRGIEGPYNRRNAYGAALSYAPVLAANARTRPMFDSVVRYAFCGAAPLLNEVGIARTEVVYPVRLRLEPRNAQSRAPQWRMVFDVVCEPALDGEKKDDD